MLDKHFDGKCPIVKKMLVVDMISRSGPKLFFFSLKFTTEQPCGVTLPLWDYLTP